MKKTLLASTAVAVLFLVPAQAADMPVKAPPRAAMTTSWAGFYIGAHAGYGYAVTATTLPDVGLDSRIIGIGSKGFVAGGLAGYNVMLSQRWVGGIEIDGSWQDIKTRITQFDSRLDMSLDWSASVRARIGYLLTPTTMLFGAAGWSWSSVDISHNFAAIESFSRSVNGPQVGFGIETMFADNWIIRTEYVHNFYDRVEFNSQVVGLVTASPWVSVIRSALIYKTGPSAPTAWTDRAPNPIWAGFYVGGMIGPWVASGKISVPSQLLTADGIGVSAVVPSALAGYNIHLAPRWLAGIEGEIAPNISTSDIKIEWTGAARARVGYLVTPLVLAYGTVGWGTAGIKNFTRSGTTLSIPIERVHALGWGTGVEAAITDRWRVRADYQRYYADTIHLNLPGGPAPIPATVKGTAQTARLGATYQLSGP